MPRPKKTPPAGSPLLDSPEYSVARELRATAERDGAALVRELHHAYEAINARHFGNQLPPAAILVTRTQSPRALGDHIPQDENGIRYRVRISPVAMRRGPRFMLDVLLHETVHLAQAHIDGDTEKGYQGHGPIFARRCNEIGATLGLAEVAARGARQGKPDCAQWPINVRPAGYYGNEDDDRDPKPKPRKDRSERDDDQEHDDERDDDDTRERLSRAVVVERAARKAITLLQKNNPTGALAVLRAAVE